MLVRRSQYAYAGVGFGDLEGAFDWVARTANRIVGGSTVHVSGTKVTGGSPLVDPEVLARKEAIDRENARKRAEEEARRAAAARSAARGAAAAAASRAAAERGAAEVAMKAAAADAAAKAGIIPVAPPGTPGVQPIQQPLYITPPAPKSTPNWLLPVGIGAGALVLLLVFRPKAVQQ